MTRLAEEFKTSITKKMMEKFEYKNFYSIPKRFSNVYKWLLKSL